jgi:nucleoside-diphosphate-sugar epimerase
MTPTLTDAGAVDASRSRSDTGLDVVTGAFSYSGSAIARLLLDGGRMVRTLTGHPERAQAHDPAIEIRPLGFDDPVDLTRSLEGCATLYNTYWVRFPYRRTTHDIAVANSRMLFQAARRAGVGRIVHVSITNPRIDSPYPYFAGKASVERALAASDVSYAIVRPAILFGGQGVLLNNMAWLLRHLPVFGIAGDGSYRIRPIHVDDLARLCVDLGSQAEDMVVNAVGPECPTFRELVLCLKAATGSTSRLVSLPPWSIALASHIVGRVLHDVLLSNEELYAMMEGLANVDTESMGTVSVSQWIHDNASELGLHYLNELDLHFR